MPFNVVITFNARQDIQSAIEWENSRAAGLGVRFLEYLYKKFAAISITPLSGSIYGDDVRYTTIAVFQYVIYYIADEKAQQVSILRVLHTRRKPIDI